MPLFLRMHRRIERAMTSTLVCLLSDILAAVLNVVVYNETTVFMMSLYSANLCIHTFVAVGCFDNWWKRLKVWNMEDSGSHRDSSDMQSRGTILERRRTLD